MHWAQDFYEYQENELATVELVMDSNIKVASVAIQGHPRRISAKYPTYYQSLEVLGAHLFPGNAKP